jgi:LPXTG-motif cell wall-anchored protein
LTRRAESANVQAVTYVILIILLLVLIALLVAVRRRKT